MFDLKSRINGNVSKAKMCGDCADSIVKHELYVRTDHLFLQTNSPTWSSNFSRAFAFYIIPFRPNARTSVPTHIVNQRTDNTIA
jgi:hypothetical protein